MEEYMTRQEHDEFSKRVGEHHERIDKRLELLEQQSAQITGIIISVQRLASNIDSLCKAQEEMNTKLNAIEARDGEMWRKSMGYIITAVLGIVIGCIFKRIGF